MLNFVENLLENERGPMNDQDLTKTDYDPGPSLVLIEGLSYFLTNFLQNLVSCQTSLINNYFCSTLSEFENFLPCELVESIKPKNRRNFLILRNSSDFDEFFF
jgi:hypothetical protein